MIVTIGANLFNVNTIFTLMYINMKEEALN